MSSSEVTDAMSQLMAITGAEEQIARSLIEACNNNVEMAVSMFYDSNLQNGESSSSSRNAGASSSSASASMPPLITDDDNVRAPIAPKREVLVEDFHGSAGISGYGPRPYHYDTDRDYAQETRWQEQFMSNDQDEESSSAGSSRPRFDDLFRPPVDLIFRGLFATAKTEGQRRNRWLLVNIQDSKVFASQVLNRDVWSNDTVKTIIRTSFVFWQAYSNQTQGEEFASFYRVHRFPYIAIIDPRTGEKLRDWNATDAMALCEDLTQFLVNHSNPNPEIVIDDNDDNGDSSAPAAVLAPRPRADEEDEALNAAIAASLQDMEEQNVEDDPTEDEAEPEPEESWQDFLGPESDSKIEIVIRYPDGARENVSFPSGSKFKALLLYITEKGFSPKKFDLYRNFPKKNLSTTTESMASIEEAGIHARDTLFVQEKDD